MGESHLFGLFSLLTGPGFFGPLFAVVLSSCDSRAGPPSRPVMLPLLAPTLWLFRPWYGCVPVCTAGHFSPRARRIRRRFLSMHMSCRVVGTACRFFCRFCCRSGGSFRNALLPHDLLYSFSILCRLCGVLRRLRFCLCGCVCFFGCGDLSTEHTVSHSRMVLNP